MGGGRARRRLVVVIVVSGGFHLLLLAAFIVDLDRRPVAPNPPPMLVWLEKPSARSPAARPSRRDPARTSVARRPSDVAPTAPSEAPSTPAGAASAESAAATPAAPALPRGLGGCRLADLERLPRDERERCEERLAQGTGGAGVGPNLQLGGRGSRDVRPYLTRPPKDGCKPVGSVKNNGPLGETSVTMAVGCARSF